MESGGETWMYIETDRGALGRKDGRRKDSKELGKLLDCVVGEAERFEVSEETETVAN